MEEFKKLWAEFVIGTKSLNYHLTKGGRTPFYLKERERFLTKIVVPLDNAWLRLSEFEREAFDERPKW